MAGNRLAAVLSNAPRRRVPRGGPALIAPLASSARPRSLFAYERSNCPCGDKYSRCLSLKKSSTPTDASSCLMRVVTLDCTLCSLPAALTILPSSATVLKINRSDRSMAMPRSSRCDQAQSFSSLRGNGYIFLIHYPRSISLPSICSHVQYRHPRIGPCGRRGRPQQFGRGHGRRALRAHSTNASHAGSVRHDSYPRSVACIRELPGVLRGGRLYLPLESSGRHVREGRPSDRCSIDPPDGADRQLRRVASAPIHLGYW